LPFLNKKLKVEAVLFDLDGTLIDSAPIYYQIIDIVFERLGVPPVSRKTLQEAMDDGDYEIAINKLAKLHEEKPGDADVLNMLGYGYRQIGNFDQARGYYLQALAADPDHRGANAYMGELYLETGELAKAEERLAVLDKECWLGCDEFTELKESIAKYKTENNIQ